MCHLIARASMSQQFMVCYVYEALHGVDNRKLLSSRLNVHPSSSKHQLALSAVQRSPDDQQNILFETSRRQRLFSERTLLQKEMYIVVPTCSLVIVTS